MVFSYLLLQGTRSAFLKLPEVQIIQDLVVGMHFHGNDCLTHLCVEGLHTIVPELDSEIGLRDPALRMVKDPPIRVVSLLGTLSAVALVLVLVLS